MIRRIIKSSIQKTAKSILLLGPRQVGKSTLVQGLKPDLVINFADENDLLTYSIDPDELRKVIQLSGAKTIFIDEVQRLPRILNTVQALVDGNKKLKFYLTGSSARKLKRGGANLLPGRVLNFNLGPLVASELNYKMDTERVLSLGALPEVYLSKNSSEAEKILKSYTASYLQEEIKAEAITRNLESFARFFQEAVISTGQFIDFSKMSKKAKLSRHAVPRYFEVLEDTLVGQRLYPFEELKEAEDLVRHPKFYLFDGGVYNGVLKNFVPSLDRRGLLAEQLVFSQIRHSAWALEKDIEVSTFRTRTGVEVDFVLRVLGDQKVYGIEVKNNDQVNSSDVEGLDYFSRACPKTRGLFVFHMGSKESRFGKIWSLPWQRGLQEIGF
jgi:predicted AAA+ superfamily ATPase